MKEQAEPQQPGKENKGVSSLQLVPCSSQESRAGKTPLDSPKMTGESSRQGGIRGHGVIIPFMQGTKC